MPHYPVDVPGVMPAVPETANSSGNAGLNWDCVMNGLTYRNESTLVSPICHDMAAPACSNGRQVLPMTLDAIASWA